MKLRFENTNYNLKKEHRYTTETIQQRKQYRQNAVTFGSYFDAVKFSEYTTHEYNKALKYLETRKITLGATSKNKGRYGEYLSLSKFDLDKLNGIQHGIKVFEGMTLKEIDFVYKNIGSISVNRGCNNRCAHCYVNAIPELFKKEPNQISRMSWEDFSSLMNGIDELNKRLDFNGLKTNRTGYLPLFYDSDCINLEMKDKNGKIYDFIEMNDLACKTTKHKGIFDTSGWSPKDKKAQERAERIVEYFLNKKNMDTVTHINISVNPFHGLNEKAVNHKMNGNDASAKKMHELYTERMANVLFTFTPLAKFEELQLIVRALRNSQKQAPNGYNKSSQKLLANEILAKLKNKYIEDSLTTKKYVKSPVEINDLIRAYKKKLTDIDTFVVSVGRGENLFSQAHRKFETESKGDNPYIYVKYGLKDMHYEKAIDANGRVYATDPLGFYTIPTEIQLNFENKDKLTQPLPAIVKDLTITKEMINS